MKHFVFLVLIGSSLFNLAHGQDCVYHTLEDFIEGQCDESEKPYIDGVIDLRGGTDLVLLKNDASDKRIKKAFAVQIDGIHLFSVHEIDRNLAKKDRLSIDNNRNAYLIAKSNGVYNYMEYDPGKGNGPGAGLGTGGISLGYAFSLGKTPVRGFIFDPVNREFNVFDNCKDFNEFLSSRHPEYSFECKKRKLDIEIVRDIIGEINGSVQQESASESSDNQRIIIYPHRSIINEDLDLTIGEKTLEFDEVSIIETNISCEQPSQLCISGMDVCLTVKCDDDHPYYIISKDRETERFLLEPSNPDDFKYYSAIIERKRSRRR
jgi:hypothetical protein